jgi:hypothetical protein
LTLVWQPAKLANLPNPHVGVVNKVGGSILEEAFELNILSSLDAETFRRLARLGPLNAMTT